MGMPTLIGAGIGAIGAAATGNNPFKGALLGGSLGTGYGGIQSLMQGGTFLQGAAPFLSSPVGGAATGIKLAPAIAGDTSLALSPVIAGGATGAGGIGSGALTGAGIKLAPMAAFDGFNVMPTAASKMGITDLANYATGSGTNLMEAAKPSWLDSITSQQVGNVIGGANVAQQYMQRRPIPQAPAGGVSRGSPPPAEAVQQLVAQIQSQQPRKRLSLLVG